MTTPLRDRLERRQIPLYFVAVIAGAGIGWLVGLASGSFGAFAYGLHCVSITVFYVGLWYTGAVALCALLGRLIVPRLIRW